MRNYLGKIALIGIVFAVGYFVFNKESVSGYTFPSIGISQKDIAKAGSQALSNVAAAAKKNLSAQVTDLANVAVQNADAFAQNAITSAKAEVIKALSSAVSKNVDNLAIGLGISAQSSTASSGNAAASPIQSAIKSGAPAYFTIKNSGSDVIRYAIDWKDGKTESGRIAKGESQIVSHAWSKAGDYILQFKIESSNGTNEYQITISIL